MNSLSGISKKISRQQSRIPDNYIISVVDAGTNTFRLLISEANFKSILSPILIEHRIVRLGEGFYKSGIINKNAEKRAIETLKEFYSISRRYNAVDFYVAGTSIFREAKNSFDLISKIKTELGISVDVLSPSKEAELSVRGCISGFKNARKILLMDIGGGSTEFILWEKDSIKFWKSLSLGVVHLSEEFLSSDPPGKEQLNKLETIIENRIKRVYNNIIKMDRGNDYTLIGTAGTVTTIGAILLGLEKYDRSRINMLKIGKKEIERLYSRLSGMTSSERAVVPGMVKGREDLIVAGIAIVRTALDVLKKKIIHISDYGLLEGLAINFLEKRGGEV